MKHHNPKLLKANNETPLNYNKFHKEYTQAVHALGLLEGSQKKLQNPDLLISPLTAKEAAVSPKIEGTVSTVSDIFLFEAGGKQGDSDARQVANYRTAMTEAREELKKGRLISNSLVKSLHSMLLHKVRHKGPLGHFREETVYIASKPTDPIEKALYIPPEYVQVQSYMDNIIDYLEHSEDEVLIKAGLFHYQFEAVHPFNDGNGRLGRLLIPLILHYEGTISSPILYLSGYIDEHRNEYRSRLHEVDEGGPYEGWLKFFFKCVAAQAKETQELIDNIYNLYDETKSRFHATKSPYLVYFVDFLFNSPLFNTTQAKKALGNKSGLTVSRLLKLFKEQKIVEELPFKLGRSKLYVFRALLNLLG